MSSTHQLIEPRSSQALLLAGVAAAVVLFGGAAAVRAEENATSGTSDATDQLQEVVVTATKRAENTIKVPISIGVVDADVIENLHVEDMEDITRLVPGIQFMPHDNGPAGPGQDNISIRGVSSTVGNPTVGIYIDEVPIITVTGYEGDAEPRLLDLERVEVLRGPQGTLYGASSEGGTVRFITNDPNSQNYAGMFRQDVSYTEHGSINYDEQGMVNIPVVDGVFALRVSAEYGQDSGYIDQYALEGSLAAGTATAGPLLQRGTNSDSVTAVHLKAEWTPTENFTVTPSIFYQRYAVGDTSSFIPSLGYYNTFDQVLGAGRDALLLPSLTMVGRFGFADFTSITGYDKRQVERDTDGTYYNTTAIVQYYLDAANTPPYTLHTAADNDILGNIPSPVTFTDHFNTWTQEFRLSSPADQQRVRWVAGIFLSDQEWSHLDYEPAPGFSAAFQNIYGYGINDDPLLNPTIGTSGYNPNFWANDLVWEVYDHNDVKEYAAFGQLDVDVTSKLHLGAGLRYVGAKEKFDEIGGGFFDFGGAGTLGVPYTQSANFSTTTPKATLTYSITDQASVYASAGKGFRLGGATTPNTNAACVAGLLELGDKSAPTTYGPDHLWSYEIGAKSLLFQNTVSVNADFYYIDWTDIQQSIVIPICGGAFNANVGDAHAYGTEVETRYKPPAIPGLELGLNLGAEHSYIVGTTNTQTVMVGQDVLFTPKFTGTLLTDYSWPLTAALSGFVRADYEYTGESYGSFQIGTPNYINPAYGVVNLSLGITASKLQFSLYGKNVLDNRTILQSPQINSVIEGYTLRPLTVGITGQIRF